MGSAYSIGPSSDPQQSLHDFWRGGEHRIDLCRIFATGFREIWPSSAASADDRRELLHQLSRFETPAYISASRSTTIATLPSAVGAGQERRRRT